jgi:uncharacterized repeat protein (TIGR02543 family)
MGTELLIFQDFGCIMRTNMKHIRRLFLPWVVLLGLFCVSCDIPAGYNADLETFVEDGLSLVSLRHVTVPESGEPARFAPSERQSVFLITVNNPRMVQVTPWIVTVPDGDSALFSVQPVVIPSGDNRTAQLTFTPSPGAEWSDLTFILSLASPTLNGREFPSETFTLRCDSAPSAVESLVGAKNDMTLKGIAGFRLPGTVTDTDLAVAEIAWRDFLSGSPSGLSQVALNGNTALAVPPAMETLLGGPDPLNRCWQPSEVPTGRVVEFTVTLIDQAGLRSDPVSVLSEPVICTLVYNGNGGTGTPPEPESVDYGSVLTIAGAGNLTLEGNWLRGWNTAPDGTGTLYREGDTLELRVQNLTLYAEWSSLTDAWIELDTGELHEVTFNPADDPFNAYLGQAVTFAPATGSPLLAGSGWNWYVDGLVVSQSGLYTADTSSIGEQLVTVTVTLNGVFYSGSLKITVEPISEYTLAYDADGGTGTLPADVTHNGTGTATAGSGDGLTRTGYTFGGWSIGPGGTGTRYAVGAGIPLTPANLTLYAMWIRNAVIPPAPLSGRITVTGYLTEQGMAELITAVNDPRTEGELILDLSGVVNTEFPADTLNDGRSYFTDNTTIWELILPNGLEVVPFNLIWDDNLTPTVSVQLRQITFPASVRQINQGALGNCRQLRTITFLGETPPTLSGDARWTFQYVGANYDGQNNNYSSSQLTEVFVPSTDAISAYTTFFRNAEGSNGNGGDGTSYDCDPYITHFIQVRP